MGLHNKGVRKSLAFEVKTLLYIFRENSGSVTIHSRAVSPNIGFYVYFLLGVIGKFVCPIVEFISPIVKFRSSHSQIRSSHSQIRSSHSQIRSSHSSIRSSQNLASMTSPRFCQNFQKLQNVHAAVEALFLVCDIFRYGVFVQTKN